MGDFALRLPATDRNFPDGLVAGALAGASKSGVVLTMGTNAIEPETLSKLQAAGTRKVTIVGGAGVVSSEVENSLRNAGIQVERIAGANRYDTAFRVYATRFTCSGVSARITAVPIFAATAEAANASGNVLLVATNTLCVFSLPVFFMCSYSILNY